MAGCVVDNAERPGVFGIHTINVTLADGLGHLLLRPRRSMDPRTQRMAALEQIGQIQRTRRWCTDTKVVVGREQLEDTE